MNTCPTVKEVSIPGCYSGVLKVNTGLEPGTEVYWQIERESTYTFQKSFSTVDTDGNLLFNGVKVDYFSTFKMSFKDQDGSDLNIKGYDCYRLMPFKNTDVVVDVVI